VQNPVNAGIPQHFHRISTSGISQWRAGRGKLKNPANFANQLCEATSWKSGASAPRQIPIGRKGLQPLHMSDTRNGKVFRQFGNEKAAQAFQAEQGRKTEN